MGGSEERVQAFITAVLCEDWDEAAKFHRPAHQMPSQALQFLNALRDSWDEARTRDQR
jgi:hypothetical protein